MRGPMSFPPDMQMRETFMFDLLEENEEQWSRLSGLLAMLALPALRMPDGTHRRRLVEIRLASGKWVPIDGVFVEAHRITFHYGTNGTRVQYPYLRSDGIPQWRSPKDEHGAFERDR